MPISPKDKEYMKRVAEYYRSTKSELEPNGSIRDTAIKFDINRNKVRKILITMGELESPITEQALSMRQRGMSIKEIAHDLGVSVATVSTALPYEDKVNNSLDPTQHASDVRGYRAYERERLKRQAGRSSKKQAVSAPRTGENMSESTVSVKEWQKDIRMSYTEAYHRPHRSTWEDVDEMREALATELSEDVPDELRELVAYLSSMKERKISDKKGQFPGALNDRDIDALEKIAGDRLPPDPMRVIRLHLELYDEYADEKIDDEDVQVLKKYGKLEYGDTISRDIIVPDDIPLYALHYVIQRAFGWQNSHLRNFELPDDRFQAMTDGNVAMWSRMVGVLFRSPLMDEEDEFWADDYNGGSFKNWLRKKYTGPYLSQCHGEGIISCLEDIKELDMDAEYYVMYSTAYNRETRKYDGEEYISEVTPVYDYGGKKQPEPKPWHRDEVPYRVEVVNFGQVPSEGMKYVFERNPMALLERLPVGAVLAAGRFHLPDDCPEDERKYVDEQIIGSGDELYRLSEKKIEYIKDMDIDSPYMQVLPMPVTDALLYNYDFGDNWRIRITASENCADLVESGRITQAELDRAHVKCREVYRPVLVARDGEMLVDDVGGIHGFTEFLKTINTELKGMEPEEKEEAKREKRESLEWARYLGWRNNKGSGTIKFL